MGRKAKFPPIKFKVVGIDRELSFEEMKRFVDGELTLEDLEGDCSPGNLTKR